LPSWIGAKRMSRPVYKARKVAGGGEFDWNDTWTVDPGWRLVELIVNVGNGLAGSCGLVDGQEVMKEVARVRISLISKATCYVGVSIRLVYMQSWNRKSCVHRTDRSMR
jgi:hypothetical protein